MCAASTCCSTSAIPISAPQKHRDRPAATRVGNLRPTSTWRASMQSVLNPPRKPRDSTEDLVNQVAGDAGNRMRKLSAEPAAAGHTTKSGTPYAATVIKLMLENNGQSR